MGSGKEIKGMFLTVYTSITYFIPQDRYYGGREYIWDYGIVCAFCKQNYTYMPKTYLSFEEMPRIEQIKRIRGLANYYSKKKLYTTEEVWGCMYGH